MRKLVWFACPFAVTVLVLVYILPIPPIWLGCVIAAAGPGLLLLKQKRLRCWIALLLGIGTAMAWTSMYSLLHIAPLMDLHGTTRTLTGTVCSYAQETAYGYKLDMEVELAGKPTRILLYLDGDAQILQPGDQLTVSAKLELPSYSYSEEQNVWNRAKGYLLTGYAQDAWTVEQTREVPLRFLPARTAKVLQERIAVLFDDETAAFMKALLTGDRSGFDYRTKNALSLAGVSHVVAISGMHVSILLALVMLGLPDRRLAAVVGIPLILFYAVLTGASPSVIRASVMQILLLLAPLLGREEDTPTSLAAAMLLILLINPWAIADLSFQLSFAAMAGLLLFGKRIYNAMDLKTQQIAMPRWLRGFCKAVQLSVSTTLGAMVFTTPLIACSFGVVSLVSVAANFLTLWAVSICFQAGIIICVLQPLLPGICQIAAGIVAVLVRYFLTVTGWLANLPFAAVYTDNRYTALLLIFGYLLIAVFLLCRYGRRALVLAGCILVGIGACMGAAILENRSAQLQTTMLDVGQGQCILLEWHGMTAMVDCGGSDPEEAGERAARLVLSHGRQRVDALILTHYDADHAGGVMQFLSRVDVGQLYLPPAEPDDTLYLQICDAAEEANVPVTVVTEDILLECESTRLHIFAPLSYQTGNDGGLSVLSSCQEYDILITGDMSTEAEHRLLSVQTLPQVELLVAGHHGSAYSTGSELLQQVQPELVLLSVGAENRYGHPAQEVLDRIEAVGASYLRTDENSTIIIRR